MSKAPSVIFSVAFSLALHAVVFAVVAVGWQQSYTPEKRHRPQYIKAELVELKPKAKKAGVTKKKPKKIDLTARRAEQERLKREAEKRVRQKQAQEKKAKEKKKRLEQERKKEAARKKAEQERLVEQRKLQTEMEQSLLEEEGQIQDELFATQAQSYAALIQQRVERYWSRPPSARNGMRCELTINLVPNGRVIDAYIKESSGNSAFDRSAIAAVKKAEQFQELREMPIELFERQFRTFTMVFQPEDLRQ